MLNRIVLIGRLTRDPELKYTPNTNMAKVTFTLAVDRNRGKGRDSETDFIRIACWDKLALLCKQHIGKGRLVAVEGSLQIQQWETPQGEKRSMAEVRANNVQFLDRPSGGQAASSAGYPDDFERNDAPAPRNAPPAAAPIPNEKLDEEIDLDEDPFKEEY